VKRAEPRDATGSDRPRGPDEAERDRVRAIETRLAGSTPRGTATSPRGDGRPGGSTDGRAGGGL
jgi:hypothetical protein